MSDVTAIVCSVEQVALLIASRTVNRGGAEQDTFDSGTRPTDVQVTSLAEIAANEVMSALGIEVVPDELVPDCTQLVALRTAQLLELSFFGGGQDSQAAATLAAAFLAGLATLQERLHWSPVRLP